MTIAKTISLTSGDPTMLAAHDRGFPVPIAYGPGRLAEIGQRCLGLSPPYSSRAVARQSEWNLRDNLDGKIWRRGEVEFAHGP